MSVKVTVIHDDPANNRTVSLVRARLAQDGTTLPEGPVVEISPGQSQSFNVSDGVYLVVAETPLHMQLNQEGVVL